MMLCLRITNKKQFGLNVWLIHTSSKENRETLFDCFVGWLVEYKPTIDAFQYKAIFAGLTWLVSMSFIHLAKVLAVTLLKGAT